MPEVRPIVQPIGAERTGLLGRFRSLVKVILVYSLDLVDLFEGDKRPLDLTDDEALERLFGKEARDKLKEVAQKADRYGKKSPHK
jgi:hypothetical protein